MTRAMMGTAAVLVALSACRTPVVETVPAPVGVQPAPLPTADAVPAGTVMTLELNQPLSTETSRVGDRFTATLRDPLVTTAGQVVIPAGAVVTGTVTGLAEGRHLGQPSAIRLDFDRITYGNQSLPFEAEIVQTDVQARRDPGQVAEHAGIGAVAGAALGAVIGGSLRDMLIGGVLGAGAGTILSLGFGDVEARIPAGTAMVVRTTQHISLR